MPTAKGKRKVVPGSMPILYRLRELGLCDMYTDTGFEISIPGCSCCVGMSADQATPGEVWISAQNRNFENRTSKGNEHPSIKWHSRLRSSDSGSIGHLASAATVAASYFEMKLVNDPRNLFASIDSSQWDRLRTTSIYLDTTNPKSDLTYIGSCGCPGYPSAMTQQMHIENRWLDKDGERQIKAFEAKCRDWDFIDTDEVSVYFVIGFVKCHS